MNKIRIALFALFIAIPLTGPIARAQDSSKDVEHREWITNVLTDVRKIKVGMTRGELLKIFAEEGGLSTGLQRTYVYQGCPYIKVDVEFTAVGRPARNSAGRVTLVESKADLIKKISRPYLEFSIID